MAITVRPEAGPAKWAVQFPRSPLHEALAETKPC